MLGKKIAAIAGAVIISTVGLAGPALAHGGGDKPGADNKKVDICHYKANPGAPEGNYSKIEVSVSGWYSGHRDHSRDIWESFTYTTKGGDTVTVPAQGDTSLLAFPDCQKPKVDEKIAKPDYTYNDVCGTKDDVFSVAPGRGYTVSGINHTPAGQSITVSLDDGFTWMDGSKDDYTITKPEFTNEDCGLPDTGGQATFNTPLGWAALGAIPLLGAGYLMTERRRKAKVSK